MPPAFPTTFEKEESPMSPLTTTSGANTPISYKANVNRNKTKKWADAKPVDYGGDDWGDDEEFDPPPPPISKPTGLRQQGQGLLSSLPPASNSNEKKTYGELPPLPGATGSNRPRVNSFDADDEKRNFSNATLKQPSTDDASSSTPATRSSQLTGQSITREPGGPPPLSITTQQLPQHEADSVLRNTSQAISPMSDSAAPDALPGRNRTNTIDSSGGFPGPARINTGESGSVYSQPSVTHTPSDNYQAQKDYSPTAVPAPLSTTRTAPPGVTDSSSSRFPTRMSSLSQSTRPDLSHKSSSPAQAPTASSSARSPTSSGKALPFIRPADIYRRVEEEKERERQSLDSSRPSMDSLVGGKASDRSESPGRPQLREKSSSDSLGGSRQWPSDDTSASSRHLQPSLEPVQERRSEYGFENFKMNDQTTEPMESTAQVHLPSYSTADLEHTRSASVSPSLPNLSRMSGFGIDLFSQPISNESEPSPPHNTNVTSAPSGDTDIDRQPSLGYRAVVNQAFERKDDTSIPPTPASRASSGVRRSDSESTGTTGISPIMSRAPSGAVSNSRSREEANPSTLAVVHEPISPEAEGESLPAGSAPVSFLQSSSQRDTRTPNSGLSPAGRQTLAAPESVAQEHAANVTNLSSLNPPDSVDGDLFVPSRPSADRGESFRPSLPGGWTSYTTTATSETSQEGTRELDRAQTPTGLPSSVHGQPFDGDREITPTKVNSSLHQANLGPAAGAGAEAGAGAASADRTFAQHDKRLLQNDAEQDPTIPIGDNSLPTTDTLNALADADLPATSDPSHLPYLESVSPEAQLRLAPAQTQDEDDERPAPPSVITSPPYDEEDYPKPTVPLKQRSMEQIARQEILAPAIGPQHLPTLSTDAHPQDEESDKLRKEIIKSLSPQPSDAALRSGLLQPDQANDQSMPNDGRYSYLPREYDNYWASTSGNLEPVSPSGISDKAVKRLSRSEDQLESGPVTPTTHLVGDAEASPIPPLNTRRVDTATDPRPSIAHRFSWEQNIENAPLAQSQGQVQSVPTLPSHQDPDEEPQSTIANTAFEKTLIKSGDLDNHRAHQTIQDAYSQDGTQDFGKDSGAPHTALPAPSSSHLGQDMKEHIDVDYDKELGAQGLASPVSEPSDNGHTSRDAALLTGGLALGGVAAVAAVRSPSPPVLREPQLQQRRLSLAEEKDPRVSTYPVSPTPPEAEHPSRSPEANFSTPAAEQLSAVPSSVSPINAPIKTNSSPASRLVSFKEIAAMQTSNQRIQTFDEMRYRFATMDSGLLDWMSDLKAQHPEHANAAGSWNGAAFTATIGSSSSKYGKATGQPLQAQQPYYQQYLNASPTGSGPPIPKPGPRTPSGSQQGFSPAAGKLTSQQVQARGKELLHTAGIFGGKAGKAGKGLLTKGKNKLRGSGAGDKTYPNIAFPVKPKNDRRTSWGFPVAISRSSSRPDAITRDSKENMPMPTETQRAESTNSQRNLAALEFPPNVDRESSILMGGVVNPHESPRRPSSVSRLKKPTHSQKLALGETQAEQPAEQESSEVHELVIKTPSPRDLSKATPIAHDEDLHYAERSGQQYQPTKPVAPHIPLSAGDDTSERSNSGDAHFYDATEEPSDLNDWVMVSPEPKVEQAQPDADKLAARRMSEHYQPPSGPPPGFLERQRAQFLAEPPMTHIEPPKSLTGPSEREVEPISEQTARLEPKVSELPVKPHPSFPSTQTQADGTSGTPQNIEREQTSAAQHSVQPEMDARDVPASQAPNEEQVQTTEPRLSNPSHESAGSVLNRPRFSYEAPSPSPIPPVHDAQQMASSYAQPQNPTQSLRDQPNEPEPSQDPDRNASFKGLPPIRRTSTFGLGFGRKSKPRFPIDDDDDVNGSQSQDIVRAKTHETEIGAVAVAAAADSELHGPQQRRIRHTGRSSTNLAQQRIDSASRGDFDRPSLNQSRPQHDSQNSIQLRAESQSENQAPPTSDNPQERTEETLNAWRPTTQASFAATSDSAISPAQRPSLEQQRSLEGSRVSGFTASSRIASQLDDQYNQGFRPSQGPTMRPIFYDQPPSSAQRYPELFQTQLQPHAELGRDGELPSHLYQAPIPREAAFLQRQQGSEYQLPGVGPPQESRPDRPRRGSSSFLKEISGRLSRGTSRERSHSAAQGGNMSPDGRQLESRGHEYPESSVASEEAQERQKRRSGFFGMRRASTAASGPPQSRESVVAHFPESRTDLLETPTESPGDDSDSRKRSLFGAASPGAKPDRVSRSSTSGMMDEAGKKKRFSGLSSVFGRSGNTSSKASQDRPQATREVSYEERQPLESPMLEPRGTVRQTVAPKNKDAEPRRSRQFLSKFPSGSDSFDQSEKPRTRRGSASNLLSGIMGRKTDQKDRGKEASLSQGPVTQASHSHQVPLGQTYSDIRDASPQAPLNQQTTDFQQPSPDPRHPDQSQERGRHSSRQPQRVLSKDHSQEPQYDNVPIPGGYDLVRGQGAISAPAGYNLQDVNGSSHGQQFDPRLQQQSQSSSRQPEFRRTSQTTPPHLSGVENYESFTKRATPRLSREDLLARSPARPQPGQQRPYTLSLPEDEQDRDTRSNTTRSPLTQHDAIQRLQQPTLRHPGSPAGYPLPDDAFSPINEAARDIPAPPPPQWPLYPNAQDQQNPNLDRSDTRRTTTSAVSGISNPQSAGLNIPNKEEESGRDGTTLSPTPPSPAYTPELEREASPPRYTEDEKELERGIDSSQQDPNTNLNRARSPDLYNTSPRFRNTSPTVPAPSNVAQTSGYENATALAAAKSASASASTSNPGAETSNSRVTPMIDTTSPPRRDSREEKIYYDAETGEEGKPDEGALSMSATSYPGQEWNPYIGAGGWEEGFE